MTTPTKAATCASSGRTSDVDRFCPTSSGPARRASPQGNGRKYPQSANCYDSLAEAFEKKGDRQQAIRNYARALSMMDPDPTGSSYQALKRLLGEKQ
jgi:tetratricopeptide (TPR) repeat protein